jgi:hypothetical protein
MRRRFPAWMLAPSVVSVVALGVLWGKSGTGWDVLLLFAVVLTWALTALLSQPNRQREGLSGSLSTDMAIIGYYTCLLAELRARHGAFEDRRLAVTQGFLSMSQQLAKAVDLSRSTGLLAANAMMAASRCGEVGRGFVTVSREMSGISEMAEQDLQTLYLMVTRLQARLSHAGPMLEGSPDGWLDPALIRRCDEAVCELDEVLTVVAGDVQRMLQRYQDEVRMDVRWLQWGDSIRKVLIGISDNVSGLVSDIAGILATTRILALSQPLNAVQRAELAKFFSGEGGAGG